MHPFYWLYFGVEAHRLDAADPGATMTFVAGGALKPIGGHILSRSSATRMFLRKGKSLTLTASYGVIWRGFEAESEYHVLTLFTLLPGRAEERVAKLVDSPDRPESGASYKLDEGGWTGV
ncbi:hypothetical protein DFH29DRAFT_1055485 [Suillus ampliporus]|nr:hypothetical protein DFH29DRAFT_1055485 [Suillus ampliporus]